MGMNKGNGAIFNAYPDSIGGRLAEAVRFLSLPELNRVFDCFYILPSLFHSDIDRGFSIIDYGINEAFSEAADLENIERMGIQLKLDFLINHISVLSGQFQDILKNGEESRYRDFFIDWNMFWEGFGEMTGEGYIQPYPEVIKDMFFRKPGLPLLMVSFSDGREVPYWNTFYQEIIEPGKKYLGQMDLNVKSPLVWDFYDETLRRLRDYGAETVRLDAFAYVSKEPGSRNFLNEPGTWDILDRLSVLANKYSLTLLPEIHAIYGEGVHRKLSEKGYLIYDFFLPGLIIDALSRRSNNALLRWIREILDQNIKTVNMLGCHDGIPLLDLKGLLADDQIESLIALVTSRGGVIKDLHGKTNVYYQVNATYYSALGESDDALLLARAIQIFMPGRPQAWYLDILAGKNDYEAVNKAGAGNHKEINRTNLTYEQAEDALKKDVVQKQLALLRFRNSFPAFKEGASCLIMETPANQLKLRWEHGRCAAELTADLENVSFTILQDQ
jgi:sucrose phosphorylase